MVSIKKSIESIIDLLITRVFPTVVFGPIGERLMKNLRPGKGVACVRFVTLKFVLNKEIVYLERPVSAQVLTRGVHVSDLNIDDVSSSCD